MAGCLYYSERRSGTVREKAEEQKGRPSADALQPHAAPASAAETGRGARDHQEASQ